MQGFGAARITLAVFELLVWIALILILIGISRVYWQLGLQAALLRAALPVIGCFILITLFQLNRAVIATAENTAALVRLMSASTETARVEPTLAPPTMSAPSRSGSAPVVLAPGAITRDYRGVTVRGAAPRLTVLGRTFATMAEAEAAVDRSKDELV